MSWQQGDRVRVHLPDHSWRDFGRDAWAWFTGTVREVDPPDLPPGVRVDLDVLNNGVRCCFATHDELESDGNTATAKTGRRGDDCPG